MYTETPSYLEDLAYPDESEDTSAMLKDLGLALLDDLDEFERSLNASDPIAADLETAAFGLLKLSESQSFCKVPSATSRVRDGEDMYAPGLHAQSLKPINLLPLPLKKSASAYEEAKSPPKQLFKPSRNVIGEPRSPSMPSHSASRSPPKSLAHTPPVDVRRTRRTDPTAGRINQVANLAPGH